MRHGFRRPQLRRDRLGLPPSRDSVRDGFVGQTLVLDRFAWSEVRGFVERRIGIDAAHCDTWDQLISRLAPFMRHSDAE
jgi:hypothetical protein